MKDSGCCGASEFLKLWAYTLTEYHRVVHLDMDSIIFRNMVSSLLFIQLYTADVVIVNSDSYEQDELYSIDKELLYTGDYNMQGNSPVPPVQGNEWSMPM